LHDYTEVRIRRTDGDEWFVSIGLWRADGSHRRPRLLRKPWEHTLFLPEGTTQDDVFNAVRGALEALRQPPEAPLPRRGAAPPGGGHGGAVSL